MFNFLYSFMQSSLCARGYSNTYSKIHTVKSYSKIDGRFFVRHIGGPDKEIRTRPKNSFSPSHGWNYGFWVFICKYLLVFHRKKQVSLMISLDFVL